MKRLPYPIFDDTSGKKYWRSLRERDESPEFQDQIAREFPDNAAEPPEGVSRRSFFRLMGASMALAGLAGCRRPNEKIVPYARQPEEMIPGKPLHFATAMPWGGTALGLLVESHEGRPTKIEGNPLHPDSLGSTHVWAQAEILSLYDVDRSDAPRERGQKRSWDDASPALRELGKRYRESRGKGLAILTEAHRSPTVARLLDEVGTALPEARIVRWSPTSREHVRDGARLAYGRPLEPVLDLGKARVVVSLDADLLMTDGSPVKQAKGWASRRRAEREHMGRLWVVESSYSVTGASADHRVRVATRDVPAIAVALARALGVDLGIADRVPADAQRAVAAMAKDLAAHRGAGLVVAGERQPAAVHALCALLNHTLGNVGHAVSYVQPFDAAPDGPRAIAELAKAITDKQVTALVILGGNPAFDAPADARFADALKTLETSVHLSSHVDETSALATWHLPRAHFLEAWGDVRAEDGTLSIVQPLIAPLLDGKTDAEVLSILLGETRTAHELVRATHQAAYQGIDFEKAWRRALHDGLWGQTAYAREDVTPAAGAELGSAARAATVPTEGLEVAFQPDYHAWDGRYANNAWLQEAPDAIHKLTWGNAAYVSPDLARQLGVGDGDVVTLTVPTGGSARVPVLVAPGQADQTITVTFGQGRTRAGRVGDEVGADVYPLRAVTGFGWVTGVQVHRTGVRDELARTQEHYAMEQRAVVREATLDEFVAKPTFAAAMDTPHPPLVSLFPDYKYDGRKWAMTIDLNTCLGCGGCTVACQAENNIPVVGKEGVLKTREMHWIRVDRYFDGSPSSPRSVSQPMPCQQCENAPCEQVCPVSATSHSPEGLNDMAYNRCIGTKYCLNNCPFKVRRFNYFHYAKDLHPIRRMAMNPDVTIRSRGVMEKCTYCVQRINAAKIEAHTQGTDKIPDGRIKTACQQACPTDAIQFGDLNDPTSVVAKLKEDPRSYVLLKELNVRPRTTYLAKIRNPHPDLG